MNLQGLFYMGLKIYIHTRDIHILLLLSVCLLHIFANPSTFTWCI